jgi:hypothetical protein
VPVPTLADALGGPVLPSLGFESLVPTTVQAELVSRHPRLDGSVRTAQIRQQVCTTGRSLRIQAQRPGPAVHSMDTSSTSTMILHPRRVLASATEGLMQFRWATE